MNKYYIAFPFMGAFQYITFTANEIANEVVKQGDDVLEALENAGQAPLHIIYGEKGKQYEVTFAYGNPHKLNVYEYISDERYDDPEYDGDGGYIVEKDIPYILLKIEDSDGKVIYNLTEHI